MSIATLKGAEVSCKTNVFVLSMHVVVVGGRKFTNFFSIILISKQKTSVECDHTLCCPSDRRRSVKWAVCTETTNKQYKQCINALSAQHTNDYYR